MSVVQSEVGQASVEEDLGMTGAVAEDAEAEFIRRVTEEELVTGTHSLSWPTADVDCMLE